MSLSNHGDGPAQVLCASFGKAVTGRRVSVWYGCMSEELVMPYCVEKDVSLLAWTCIDPPMKRKLRWKDCMLTKRRQRLHSLSMLVIPSLLISIDTLLSLESRSEAITSLCNFQYHLAFCLSSSSVLEFSILSMPLCSPSAMKEPKSAVYVLFNHDEPVNSQPL